jgi:hypothetical protein
MGRAPGEVDGDWLMVDGRSSSVGVGFGGGIFPSIINS